MITYPLNLPASPPGFRTFDLNGNAVVGLSVSPFTGQQQIYEWPGSWWEAKVSLPPMKRADAERWIGFLLALRGRAGTFLMGDPLAKTARGIATGTPQVNGAGQTGKTLATKGWTANKTGILLAGDYFQLGSGSATRLHKLLKDANSDGTGLATLDIFPSLRESPANNDALTISSARGTFRLAANKQGFAINVDQTYGIGFEAVEAF